MSDSYNLVLRACPEETREAASAFLAKVFSIKDSTCAQIVGAAPIQLLTDLSADEAAAASLVIHGIRRCGAVVEFLPGVRADLPKIDWPRRPLLFKRDLVEHVADLQMEVPTTEGPKPVIDLLLAGLGIGVNSGLMPPLVMGGPAAPVAAPVASSPTSSSGSGRQRAGFTGVQLPEVTPFGTPALPGGSSLTPSKPAATQPAAAEHKGDDTLSRLNELFPEDDGAFMPRSDDITSMLNKILPDESPHLGGNSPTGDTSSKNRAISPGGGQVGWSVFLPKITDDARREKAVVLLMEIAKITKEEAEALSKKMIIPVLKGANQADAEAVKQKFAKIGLLARVKGPE